MGASPHTPEVFKAWIRKDLLAQRHRKERGGLRGLPRDAEASFLSLAIPERVAPQQSPLVFHQAR